MSDAAREVASQVRGLVLVRFLISSVLGLLILGAQRAGTLPGDSPGPLLALLIGVWTITLLYWAGFRVGLSLGGLLGFQTVLDLVIETVLVGGTGGLDSPLVLLYFLTVISSGMYFRWGGAVLTAAGATVAVAILTGFERAGPHGDGTGAAWTLYEVGVRGGVLLVVALLSATLSERSRRHRQALESKSEELHRVVHSTDRIMESMPIGLLTASDQGVILRTNRAAREILAVKPNVKLAGQDVGAFLGSLDPSLVDALESALLTRKWAIRDEILVERGGQACPVGVSVTPLVVDDDVLEGVIVTFTDLKQVRQMEIEMRRSEQLASLGELAAGMAHEIRNPLASISGAVQMLRSEFAGEGDEADLMDLIVAESDRLNRTINGMLDYTRDHSNSLDFHDVAAIAREVGRLMSHDRSLSIGKTILLEFPEQQSFRAQVEEAGLRQVFFNLARNALEAMGVGGILRITGESPGDGRLFVVFRDTGEGIPPHELENIFKPFHTTKRNGSGLGLSIASRIIEGNGGVIRVKSTPGVGTAITVELPTSVVDPGSSPGVETPMTSKRAPVGHSGPAPRPNPKLTTSVEAKS